MVRAVKLLGPVEGETEEEEEGGGGEVKELRSCVGVVSLFQTTLKRRAS